MADHDRPRGEDDAPLTPEELRHQAEEHLGGLVDAYAHADTTAPAREGLAEALHELRVHQIELEMQNEELRRAQRESLDSRQKYFDLFDTAPVGYLTVNAAGLVEEANLAATRMLGVERQRIIGRPLSSLVVTEDRDAYYLANRALLRTDEKQDVELRLYGVGDGIGGARTGSFWVRLQSQPGWANGELTSTRWTFSDITERKQREVYRELSGEVLQALNEPRELHDSMEQVLALLKTGTGVDAVGIRLQDGDDFPYLAQTGLSPEFLATENTLIERDADGEACRDRAGDVILECTCGLVISGKTDPSDPMFTAGGSFWTNDSMPLLDLAADQDPRHHPRNVCMSHGYTSMALVPIRNRDRIVGLIHLGDQRAGRFTLEMIELLEEAAEHIGAALMRTRAEDKLRVSETKLRQGNESLETRVAERTHELGETIEELVKASEAKTQFLRSMSHELRTPLNSVIGFSSILADGIPGPINEEQHRQLAMINNSGLHLLALVNDILDLARIEAGTVEVHLEPIDIPGLLAEVVASVEPAAADKKLELTLDWSEPAPRLSSDPTKIRQILLNLLGNAIKFTDTGAVVVRAYEPSAHTVAISVSDTGPGIKASEHERIFGEFERGAGQLPTAEGTGLGLAICRGLAGALGGAIVLTTEMGEGSTFTLTLPSRASDPAAPEAEGR